MPKDDERKEMTQEEIDAREEKFRTFFTTSVAQVPEEMTRRDDENEEKPKSLLGRLLRREKGEQQESGTPEESRTGEIQLGGEEPEEPSDLELVLTLEEEVTEPKPEQPKPAEPVSAPQPEQEKPQKPAEPIKAPEPPAPKPEKKPAEKQAAPRKKAVQYELRTPQEQYEDREMQALKAMLFGAKLPPQEEEPPQPVKPAAPEKSTPAVPVIATKPDAEKEPDAAPEKPAVPMPAMVFAEDKASKPHAAPAMQFFGKGDDEKAPAAPARATPPDNDDSMSLPLMFLNDGDEVAPVEPPKEEAPAQPAKEAGTAPAAPEAAPVEEAPVEEEKTPETPEQVGERLHQMGAALTLRCALGGILALVLLHFGLAAEGLVGPLGGLDPVTAPAAFYAANLLFLALALAVGWPVVRDGLKGLRGERPSMETMPAMAAWHCWATVSFWPRSRAASNWRRPVRSIAVRSAPRTKTLSASSPRTWTKKTPGCCSADPLSGTTRWWSRASAPAPVSAAPVRRITSCWVRLCWPVWSSASLAAASTAALRR